MLDNLTEDGIIVRFPAVAVPFRTGDWLLHQLGIHGPGILSSLLGNEGLILCGADRVCPNPLNASASSVMLLHPG